MTKLFTNWSQLPRWFWPVLIGLYGLLHLPFFTLPPIGPHTWRQCNTMAVARNFYEEDMNILRPRVDRCNDSDGVTGMQFPSYEWITASAYKAFGFHEAIPRVLNWLITVAGLVFCYHLFRLITGSAWMGAVTAWGLAWSPEIFYHSINALPDILALTASLGGLWYFLRWWDTHRPAWFWLSLGLMTLAGLTKLQFLLIGLPIAGLLLQELIKGKLNWRRDLGPLLFYAVVSVGVTLLWYAYAVKLIKTSGLEDFGLEIRSETNPAEAFSIIKRNLFSDVPELLLGYGITGLLVAGIGYLFRHRVRTHVWFWPGLLWTLGLVVYYFLELHQMRGHTYYMLPLLPALLLAGAVGAEWLRRLPRWHLLLALLLVVQPIWAGLRVIPRWMKEPTDVPAAVFYPESRASLQAAVPDNALCIVGPDESGCRLFYFLHKKGFGLDAAWQLNETSPQGQPFIADCIARGARYLYLSDSTLVHDARLAPYLGRVITRSGQVQVLELRASGVATH